MSRGRVGGSMHLVRLGAAKKSKRKNPAKYPIASEVKITHADGSVEVQAPKGGRKITSARASSKRWAARFSSICHACNHPIVKSELVGWRNGFVAHAGCMDDTG